MVSIKQSTFFLVYTQRTMKVLMNIVIRMFQMNLHIQGMQLVWISLVDPNLCFSFIWEKCCIYLTLTYVLRHKRQDLIVLVWNSCAPCCHFDTKIEVVTIKYNIFGGLALQSSFSFLKQDPEPANFIIMMEISSSAISRGRHKIKYSFRTCRIFYLAVS